MEALVTGYDENADIVRVRMSEGVVWVELSHVYSFIDFARISPTLIIYAGSSL